MKDKKRFEILCKNLKPKRITHTEGVMEYAVMLAEIYGVDEKRARRAAMLHDCAKYVSTEDKIKLCNEHNIEVTNIERNNPELLHAKVGAILAKEIYEVDDEEILSAITYHTTGKPDMTMLEKIIFVSDYLENGRTHSPRLDEYREVSKVNLDKCVALILEETCIYLKERENNQLKAIDPMTKMSYEYYKIHLND